MREKPRQTILCGRIRYRLIQVSECQLCNGMPSWAFVGFVKELLS